MSMPLIPYVNSSPYSFLSGNPDSPSYEKVTAYVRLGHKYQMSHVLAQGMRYLQDHFVSDFQKWCDKRPQWTTRGGYVPPCFEPIHAIGVVNSARLAGWNNILPTALVICCSLAPQELLSGFERKDGSFERLSHEDLMRCLAAKSVLMQKTTCAVLRAFPTNDLAPCSKRARCQVGLRDLLHGSLASDETLIAYPYPFEPWSFYVDGRVKTSSICSGCFTASEQRLLCEQREIWYQLPEIFAIEVESWDPPAKSELDTNSPVSNSDSSDEVGSVLLQCSTYSC